MPTIPRYLITTADERTWKFDRPVIFLGEWCRIYDRKHIWQGMDAIVAAPYGLGKTQKDADHAEARGLEDKLVPILCNALNQYHGVQHGARFWQIVLGHWLRRYVDVILNRIRTLESCLQSYRLTGTTVLFSDRYDLAPLDSNSAIWAFNDDRWNNALYVRILDLLAVTNCPVEVVNGDKAKGFRWIVTVTHPLKKRILKLGYEQAKKLARYLVRENDIFIINSYLPRKEEIKLQLALGQVPQMWTSQEYELTQKPDRAIRQSLSDQIAGKTSRTTFEIMCSLVFELLPVCYMEGFTKLTEKTQQLHWPKRPNVIFTSNNFDTDEIFKLWTALKVESGTKYITGQHGNNYGTYRYMHPSIEETTADKFLTWGWTDGLPQHTPTFINKTLGRKAGACNPNGGLVLMEDISFPRLVTWDCTHEYEAYFANQVAFIEKLQNTPRKKLTVRLHQNYVYYKSFDLDRWNDFDPDLKVETGVLSFWELVSQSRLITFSYDSTGMLETISQNIPTLAFWQNGFDHLRDSAKPYYQILADVGIIHLTAESAAAKVNEIWDDVNGWWAQDDVKEARKQFCDRYARVNQHPIRNLKKLLQE